MFTKHNLFQIPLASEELEEAFGGQVLCRWVTVPGTALMTARMCTSRVKIAFWSCSCTTCELREP